MNNSDKDYWHQYIPFYESFFQGRTISKIAEIGLFHGDSVRWLLERFPDSAIIGADILPAQPDWPVDSRFLPYQLDQASRHQLDNFFSLSDFDLIIDDGSHYPQHQINTLLSGMDSLNSNGIYIVEDIHTNKNSPTGNLLSVLMALEHYRKIGVEVDTERAMSVSNNSLLQVEDVIKINSLFKEFKLYRRTQLPDRCFSCGRVDFIFSSYRCVCGEGIFNDDDSMSFVLIKK